MSVISSERKEGQLQVLKLCSDLMKYTIERCASEKVFPKKTRWIMSNKVAEECLNAFTCIRRANSLRLDDEEEYKLRRLEQRKAKAHLDALLGLVDIAYQSFNIDYHTIEYWTKLIVDTENKLLSWAKSDRERLKK